MIKPCSQIKFKEIFKKISNPDFIVHIFQIILSANLIILTIILTVFLIKETGQIAHYSFYDDEKVASYLLIEGIVVWFLFFEFIALIIKYFQACHHFPLRYFIYIGITAILRLIIVDHERPINTFVYSGAILLLVIALYLANTDLLKRE